MTKWCDNCWIIRLKPWTMKKLFYFLLFICFSNILLAQIPNAGMENWTNAGAYDDPVSWWTYNATTSSTGIYTVTKGTSAPAEGLAYAKLYTKDLGNGVVKPGILVSGQYDPVAMKPISGFPYTSRPEKLKGKWQYMGFGADVASISAWLTKWNPSTLQRDTIATLNGSPSGMLHAWGPFSFSFVYQSGDYPDTAVIMISSSSANPVKNSFIWVDDLSFDGNVTGIETRDQFAAISIYPNPASSYTKVVINSPVYSKATIRLSDNIGNQVFAGEEEVNPGVNPITLELNSPKIRSGIYFLKIETSSGKYTRKLIINK